MRRVFGLRFAVEAVFVVAVPVVALELGGQWPAIVAAAGVGYLLVFVTEALIARSGRSRRRAPALASAVDAAPERAPVPEPEPAPEPAVSVVGPARDAPGELEPEQPGLEEAEPEPERVRVLQAVPDPEPEPEPETRLEPEPDAEPEVEREPEPEPAPPTPIVPIAAVAEPRRWNVWDLERLTREHHGDDAVRDEERAFLLMYLRDFAGPDGLLPLDFDALVRDSFGELVVGR